MKGKPVFMRMLNTLVAAAMIMSLGIVFSAPSPVLAEPNP
jgi:hypothetical protein